MESIPAAPGETNPSTRVPGDLSPLVEYGRRKQERQLEASRLERTDRNLGNARLIVFLAGAGVATAGLFVRILSTGLTGLLLVLLLALFLALVIAQDGVVRRRAAALRILRYYERGLARLEDRWQGQGPSGERFRDPGHPYADDLDLFGNGSLFELVCTARSHEGERMLAGWLLAPAEPPEIRSRQEAVRDLTPRLKLREDLAGLGEEVRTEVRTQEIARWGGEPAHPLPALFRAGAVLMGVTTAAALTAWGTGHGALWFVASLVVGQAYLGRYRESISRTLQSADRLGRDIGLFTRLIARLEAEEFHAPRLRELRAGLERAGPPPSVRLARLERILGFQQSLKNGLFGITAAALLVPVQIAAALETWRAENGTHLAQWIEAAAELEALSAFGAYAFEHPDDPFPELVDEGPFVAAEALAHPLLPVSRAVPNDLTLGAETRLLVISGSNMSGKSTLLRALGTNIVLALAGAPVRARSLRLSPLAIGTSIHVQDSLQAGASRFYAEITRLRQVVDGLSGPLPLLFMLDEILHGTNSHDRRIGAEAVVRTLVTRGAIGLVTTHDLALTRIVEDESLQAVNVHFEDHLEDGKMTFDYRLHAGVVQKSNALELMRAVGLDV